MKKTSIFLLLLLPFALFAQKADQCLCTEEDFYDDDFLDLFKDTKDEVVAVPDAQNVSYMEVNSFSYQQLAPDVSTVEIEIIEADIEEEIEQEIDNFSWEMDDQEIVEDIEVIEAPYDLFMQQQVIGKPAKPRTSSRATTTTSSRKPSVKKRKKITRTRVKSRKKVRKYRGKCPAF